MPEENWAQRRPGESITRMGGIFWGIALLIVGVLWLLNEARVISVPIVVILPLLILLLGVWLLLMRRFFAGAVLAFVGGVMLFASLGMIPVTWGLIIPIVIIIVGIWLLATRLKR